MNETQSGSHLVYLHSANYAYSERVKRERSTLSKEADAKQPRIL